MSTDFIREIEEDLRKDRLQRLFDRYGLYIIAGVLLILAGVGGWQFWRSQQEARAAEQTAALVRLSRDQGTAAGARAQAFADLAGNMSGERTVLARLQEAGARLAAGDTAAAVAIWEAIHADAAVAPAWRQLALVLIGLHTLYGADPAALAGRLSTLDTPTGAYRHSAREMLAILALRQNDTARARTLLETLQADTDAPEGVRTRAADLLALHGGGQ